MKKSLLSKMITMFMAVLMFVPSLYAGDTSNLEAQVYLEVSLKQMEAVILEDIELQELEAEIVAIKEVLEQEMQAAIKANNKELAVNLLLFSAMGVQAVFGGALAAGGRGFEKYAGGVMLLGAVYGGYYLVKDMIYDVQQVEELSRALDYAKKAIEEAEISELGELEAVVRKKVILQKIAEAKEQLNIAVKNSKDSMFVTVPGAVVTTVSAIFGSLIAWNGASKGIQILAGFSTLGSVSLVSKVAYDNSEKANKMKLSTVDVENILKELEHNLFVASLARKDLRKKILQIETDYQNMLESK